MNDKSRLIEALTDTHRSIRMLVTSLSDEQLSVAYHPGINPPLWEIGHTAYFFEYFILRALEGAPSWNPAMDDIWDSFNIDHRDRWTPGLVPDRASTLQYVDTMHEAILARIEVNPLSPEALYLYRYAIFHQTMHIESMLWCRQTLAYERAGYKGAGAAEAVSDGAISPTAPSAEPHDVAVPAGTYQIGMPQHETHDSAYFAFDNEKPGFEITLQAFFISEYLVSNREYMAFVDDLGYERADLWSWGGKRWLRTTRLSAVAPSTDSAAPKHPIYWRRQDGVWMERHFSEWLPLELDHPVTHVTYWEAEAFCNWAGRRLPTEYEWEAAALGNKNGLPFKRYPWGDSMDEKRVDMNGKHFARVPVWAYADGSSPFGCRQMIGTVWEWTSSQFLPYDGFAVDMYPYMSTLQFGDHKTTKGGSCATSSRLVRGTYRQAYTPDRNDVFVGFRTCAL
ncbi:MAG: ergothioneine biosynthesis protein EgtB [Gammaproteobacteria bacterium]|jgi:iron(II)-dependent oxidoreductase|nr:ergothioneine biosynthesis protein EgtB [Gammaproteobacteria bacterium]